MPREKLAIGSSARSASPARSSPAVAAARAAKDSDNPDTLQAALDQLAAATQPLAERIMNAVVKATLAGHTPAEVTTQLVEKPQR